MATTKKKAAPRKGKPAESKSGAGAAIAERSKDAKKQSFGKAAPKSVKSPAAKASTTAKTASPVKTASPAKTSGDQSSIAARIMHRVKDTATIAVGMAASIMGRDDKESRKPKQPKA